MTEKASESGRYEIRDSLGSGLLSTGAGRTRRGFRIWFVPLLAIIIGGPMWYSLTELRSTMKEDLHQNLTTILEARIASLELWHEDHRQAATSLAEITEVKDLAATLVELGRGSNNDVAALSQAPGLAALRELISPPLERHGYVDFGIVDRGGLILSATTSAAIGSRIMPEHMVFVNRAFDGNSAITRPYAAYMPVDEDDPLQPGTAAISVFAPLRDAEGNAFAVLRVCAFADEIDSLLTSARAGLTGETYMFDADGVLLSSSRFEDDLRAIGLLHEDPTISSIFNVDIRNPGGDMTVGHVPASTRRAQPLTLMAASAIAGESGVDVEGYADYRGAEVVGAWRWLDRYGLGVATERDAAEAYAGLNRLTAIQAGIAILLAVAGIAVVLQSVVIARLGRRVGEVALEVRQLGQYTLGKKIGKGGMGEVYQASHAMLRRPTAVKILRPDQAGEANVARFEREVQLTAQLTHPNTVAVYDFGRTPDNLFYYAMEYLHGINVQDLVDQTGPLPAGRVIHTLQQACGSLSEAHAIGLIHRDIKPANIILCNRGGVHDFAKVLDFGIVKVIDGDATKLSQTGMLAGTPLYIAPEALRESGRVDARIDVYALGAVAYFMITGHTIFPDDLGLVDVLTRQLGEVPLLPSKVIDEVPGDLENLIMRCLEKDPDARPASTGELFADLSNLHAAGSWDQPQAEKWWALHSDLAGLSTTGEEIVASSKVMQARAVDHNAVTR